VARTFRCLHSIRGLAASAGFLAAAELAHQAELALDAVRSGRIKISTAFIDTLEDGLRDFQELNPDTNRRSNLQLDCWSSVC
jgi:chemotaxis protein histidine kinase CheA